MTRRMGVVSMVLLLMIAPWAIGQTRMLIVSTCSEGSHRIQDAINAAADGGIVVIEPGIYRENLEICRPATILGQEGVILEPETQDRPAMTVDQAVGVSIYGVQIRNAAVGIDVSVSSCLIADCTIRASKIGVRIMTFADDLVSLCSTVVHGEGFGVSVLGSGTTALSICEFDGLATGASIGGIALVSVSGCTFERCYDGLVIASAATAILADNLIGSNHGSGVRLDASPGGAEEGSLALLRNTIEANGRWGLSLCGVNGMTGVELFGQILGWENQFADNGLGATCPVDLPLPEAFFGE